MLPETIAEELKIHLQGVKIIHQQDLEKGSDRNFLFDQMTILFKVK